MMSILGTDFKNSKFSANIIIKALEACTFWAITRKKLNQEKYYYKRIFDLLAEVQQKNSNTFLIKYPYPVNQIELDIGTKLAYCDVGQGAQH
jgi:uncharacterized protein YqfB (UPF0267 family)